MVPFLEHWCGRRIEAGFDFAPGLELGNGPAEVEQLDFATLFRELSPKGHSCFFIDRKIAVQHDAVTLGAVNRYKATIDVPSQHAQLAV